MRQRRRDKRVPLTVAPKFDRLVVALSLDEYCSDIENDINTITAALEKMIEAYVTVMLDGPDDETDGGCDAVTCWGDPIC